MSHVRVIISTAVLAFALYKHRAAHEFCPEALHAVPCTFLALGIEGDPRICGRLARFILSKAVRSIAGIEPSRAVVLTHVLSNPRIPPGRPMLWSVQGGSIILLLFETAIRLSRCQDFTNSPSLNNPTKHPKTDSSQMYGWKAGDMDYMESMDKARLNPKWEKQISWVFWTEKKCDLFQKLVKS